MLAELFMKALAKHCGDDDWQAYSEEAAAVEKALADAGLVVVPKEPTEAMLDAADTVLAGDGRTSDVYRAMIAAR